MGLSGTIWVGIFQISITSTNMGTKFQNSHNDGVPTINLSKVTQEYLLPQRTCENYAIVLEMI